MQNVMNTVGKAVKTFSFFPTGVKKLKALNYLGLNRIIKYLKLVLCFQETSMVSH